MASPVDVIATCTVRIVGSLGDGSNSIGTGFLYAAQVTDAAGVNVPGQVVPMIVTNQHVVAGCGTIAVLVTIAPVAPR